MKEIEKNGFVFRGEINTRQIDFYKKEFVIFDEIIRDITETEESILITTDKGNYEITNIGLLDGVDKIIINKLEN